MVHRVFLNMLTIQLSIWLYLMGYLYFSYSAPTKVFSSHNILSTFFFLSKLQDCAWLNLCNCYLLCLECSSLRYMNSCLLHLFHFLQIYSQISSYWSSFLTTSFLTATTCNTPYLFSLSYLYLCILLVFLFTFPKWNLSSM